MSSGREENLKIAERPTKRADVSPRERILDAARELFYSRGIRNVGVDEIAAAAQTNKMTLYRHFESKDLLVAEYLRTLAARGNAVADEAARSHPGDACAQIHAWISRLGADLANADRRGCPMANAAVEIPEKNHPARAVIEEYKTHQREWLAGLCRDAGFVEPERLADEIFLLLEGACINIQSVGRCGPGSRFAEMVCALMKSRARHADHR
jgi:AcrR family transcriptional regulator